MYQNGVLIHWDVISDPFSLLKTIVTNKNLNKKIYVRRRELFVAHWDAYQAPIECGRDLSDPKKREGLLEILAEMPWTDKNNFEFTWKNLYLAIRILNFALDEGIISIIDDDVSNEGWNSFKNLQNDPLFESVIANITAFPSYDGWMCVTDSYVSEANVNLAFSLEYKLELVVNSTNFDKIGYGKNLFKNKDAEVFNLQSSILKEVNLDKWSEFQYLIAAPELFFKITTETKKIVETKILNDEIKMFVPKYLGDFFTFGGISAAHLIYKKYKHWKNK